MAKKKLKIKARETASRKGTFRAVLLGDRIISNSSQAIALYNQSRFGELDNGKIHYPMIEAIYLAEKGKMEIFSEKKKLSKDKLMQQALKKEPNFFTKYAVFKDMRNRGYLVKTALKFGADFRVYDKGAKPGEEHARWVLFPVSESSVLTWHDFAAKNRVAHSTNKNLLIGIVDDEGDVTYYEIRWQKP